MKQGHMLLALAASLSMLATAGCAVDDDAASSGEEPDLSEATSSLVVGGRYCTRASTSAYRNSTPAGPPECSGFGSTFPVTATLSAGTLLIISANCGNPAFVNGRATNGSYYMVRASSLISC